MDSSLIRKPLILVGIMVSVMIVFVYLFVTADNEKEVATENTVFQAENMELQEQAVTPIPITTVLTKAGTKWKTRDFLHDADVELYSEAGEIYLLDEERGVEGAIYQNFYYKNGGGIVVSLQSQDLPYARARAEEALQKRLGLTVLEMCALMVSVTVPIAVSEDYSGMDLGLSFCPGSITF